jgi:hypothetical protein
MSKAPFFVKALRILALLVIVFGVISLALGLAVATGAVVEPEPGAYLGNRTSSEAIDQGIYRIIVGFIMGAIAQIAHSVSKSEKE